MEQAVESAGYAGSDGGPHKSRREMERQELKSLLASPLLSRAPSLSKILTYICDRYFEGATAIIKEYNIAVEALGRPADFNPGLDTIVRVEASRLRKRLRQYYEAEGAGHAVHILLPEGGYVPQFLFQFPDTPSAGSGRPPEPVSGMALQEARPAAPPAARPNAGFLLRYRMWLFVAAAVAAAAAGLQFVRQAGPRTTASGVRAAIPRIAPGSVPQPGSPAGSEVRIVAGYQGSKCVDSLDREWLDDRYFSGGAPRLRPVRRIYRTRSPELFLPSREGDFRYDIPLAPGVYELHLHFAEVLSEEADLDSGGERTRTFNVSLNGERILRSFDIVSDAGGLNIADERVFKDVSPAPDGFLHLEFSSVFNKASVSGIEVVPGTRGRMRPVRIRAAERGAYDSAGNLWGPDRYFLGGRITRRAVAVQGTPDPMLFGSERWGHFSYAIPVATGRYRLTLKFAETYPTAKAAQRVFDVYCNGVALLSNFDVYAEAGGLHRPIEKVFTGLTPNAQGKLVLTFVPVQNYAIVNAIMVEDESGTSSLPAATAE
jgi:hypothetical protein